LFGLLVFAYVEGDGRSGAAAGAAFALLGGGVGAVVGAGVGAAIPRWRRVFP
jgi:hypothetical protein